MTPEQISESFRQARLAATALVNYPGNVVPQDLDSAYRIQEMSLSAWPDQVRGWKVAMIQPTWRGTYPAERLAGPIFARTVWNAATGPVHIPIIENGYAAVEAEFAIRIAHPIPAATATAALNDPLQLLPFVEGVYAAIELAASPLATLSALGPGAVASDFGNNSGLVVGARLPTALLAEPGAAKSATAINGVQVGSGDASRVPGGPLDALRFLVEHLGHRGRSLQAGDWVSTGATTGIHPVRIGDRIIVSFGDGCEISAEISAAQASH